MNMNTQQLIIWAVIGIVAGWLASVVVGGGSGLLALSDHRPDRRVRRRLRVGRGRLEAQPRQRAGRAIAIAAIGAIIVVILAS